MRTLLKWIMQDKRGQDSLPKEKKAEYTTSYRKGWDLLMGTVKYHIQNAINMYITKLTTVVIH